ncbi:MAG: hypothetical protein KGS48_17790 [Bacteroidetes bacterium]|nr:hypothetical protein [Bacteroidota bacterium]
MKKGILLLVMCLITFSQIWSAPPGTPPRTTLWLGGPSLTSPQWLGAISSAQSTFNFNQINTTSYYTNTIANDIPGWAQNFNSGLINSNKSDVLGIGHDAGGLILRYMASLQSENTLSALILDGVPNHGGNIFSHLLPTLPGVHSEAQLILESALNYKTQAQNCIACRTIEATQSYIEYFAIPSISDYYRQMIPGNSAITNLQTPTIPYAIIWGNENNPDGMGLTRLMSSWYNSGLSGQDNEYLDCMGKELEERLISAKQNFAISTLQAIAGFAKATLSIKSSLTLLDAGAIVSDWLNALAIELRGLYDLKNEYREILECELVHQALNAKWTIMLSPYHLETLSYTVPSFTGPCCDDCWTQYAADHDDQVFGYCLSVCSTSCDNNNGYITYTENVLVPEPNDALYTQTEQTLAGAAKPPYEAKGCNHMQESFWSYKPINDAFTDLFMGGAGAAFVVPKY